MRILKWLWVPAQNFLYVPDSANNAESDDSYSEDKNDSFTIAV